jgi:hypothetical protein
MSGEDIDIAVVKNPMPRVILVGGAIGAAIGVLAAYLWLQRENKGQPLEFKMGDGVKIGALVVALLKNIANV